MKMRVCDICRKYYPEMKMKYKARMINYTTNKWCKIELCGCCLDKIIKAKENTENG